MAGRFAADTKVEVETSKKDIERLLMRYKADQFIYGWEDGRAVIGFRIQKMQIRMYVPLPSISDPEIVRDQSNRLRAKSALAAALEQSHRQRWRSLLLVVKAKLEAIEVGISTIEREFLADTVMANGQTVHEWAGPQLKRMYLTGNMPSLLPGLPPGRGDDE